jgi:hypothetical protein
MLKTIALDQGDFIVKVTSEGLVTVSTGMITLTMSIDAVDLTINELMDQVSKAVITFND